MQHLARSTECGLTEQKLILTQKTKALNPETIPLPRFHISNIELDICHQYKYLGVIANNEVHKTLEEMAVGAAEAT